MNEVSAGFLDLVSEDFSLRLAVTLLHFLWQGVAIGALVFLLDRILRTSSANSRYSLHTAAMILMPLCVVMTFTVAEVPSEWRPFAKNDLDTAAARSSTPLKPVFALDGLSDEMATDAPVGSSTVDVLHSATSRPANAIEQETVFHQPSMNTAQGKVKHTATSVDPQRMSLFSRLVPAFVLIYYSGVALFLVRLVIAIRGGQRLRLASREVDDPQLLQVVAGQARKVGLRLVPAVRYCERVSVPVVVGLVKPAVLLPASLMSGLTTEQFAAIISHELAHIRRYDLLVNLLQRVVESFLFFHPVVWSVSGRMSEERETCCDDLVVTSGYKPMDYAGALLRMAEICSMSPSVDAHAVAASGDHPSQLESRIWRLVNMNHESRFRMTRAGVLMIGMLTLTVIGMPAVVHSLAQAGQGGITPSQDAKDANRNANQPSSSDSDQSIEKGSKPTGDEPQKEIDDRQMKQQVSPETLPIWARSNIGHDPIMRPDGRQFLIGRSVCDVSTGKFLQELDGRPPQVMKASSNGRFLVICTPKPLVPNEFAATTLVEVWDLVSLKKVGRTISVPAHRLDLTPSNITVSSDGKKVVAVTLDWLATGFGPNGVTYDSTTYRVEPIQDQGGIIVWDAESGEKETHPYSFSGGPVNAVALSPDDQSLVISDQDNLICWRWKTEEAPITIPVERQIVSLAFSPDSRYLAEGPRMLKGDLRIRDMRTLKVIRTLKTGRDLPLFINTGGLTFTGDGKRLIAGNAISADELQSDHRIYVWNLRSGKLLHEIATPHHQVWSLDVPPDGTKIAARLVDGGKSALAVWDISENETSAAADKSWEDLKENLSPPVQPEFLEMDGWHQVSHTGYWDGWFRPHGRTQYGSYEISSLREVDGAAAVVLRHTIEDADHRVRLDNGKGVWRVGKSERKHRVDQVIEELVVFEGLPVLAPSFVALDLRPRAPEADRPRKLVGQDLEFLRWGPAWMLYDKAPFAQTIERRILINGGSSSPANRTPYLVDLDGGNLLQLPVGVALRSRTKIKLRLGYDLELEIRNSDVFLKYNVAVFRPARSDSWVQLTPQQLADELAAENLSTGVRVADSSRPTDFLFKTRDGGMGLLRVTQPKPGSITLLIKPVMQTVPADEIRPGITFDQVMAAKGRHYRPTVGPREGQLILVYDDISVDVDNHSPGNGDGTVSRVNPTPRDIEELVKDIPYADEVDPALGSGAQSEEPTEVTPNRSPGGSKRTDDATIGPPEKIAQRWKPSVEYAVSVRMVSNNDGTERETTTNWLPFEREPDDLKRSMLFGSTASAGWCRARFHWFGGPMTDFRQDGFRFFTLRTEPPKSQRPSFDHYERRGDNLAHIATYTEGTCFLDIKRIDEEQVELSLNYLGLEFEDAFVPHDDGQTALYGVLTPRPITRRMRLGEEAKFVVVNDEKRKATKTVCIRILKHNKGDDSPEKKGRSRCYPTTLATTRINRQTTMI